MSYTDFMYAIGDFATDSFALLRVLGAGSYGWFNWALIAVGIAMMAWWMGQMKKFDKESEENGTLR